MILCCTLGDVICPMCSGETEVKRTRVTSDGRSVVRLRVCKDERRFHRFETVERRAAQSIDQVLIRRSGDNALAEGGFNRRRLLDDVRNGVLKRLSDADVAEAVRAAINDIEVNLPDLLMPLTEDEQQARPGHVGCIYDFVITDAVESQLRRASSRMAHVLYALYIRGRTDREGRRGWSDARDVLEWLVQESNYPHLALELPSTTDVPVDRWYPAARAPEPEIVLKRHGRPSYFRPRQFVESIRKALLGRPEPARTAQCVSQWVLWNLVGQGEVLSSQLAVGVLDCLRRVDDIAYLRWVSIAKGIEAVTSFAEEARALVTDPSPRLEFHASEAHIRPAIVPDDRCGHRPVADRPDDGTALAARP